MFQRAGGAVGADCTEVCGSLAVKQAEIAQFNLAEGTQAMALDLPEEQVEAVPVILAEVNPEVRNHERS